MSPVSQPIPGADGRRGPGHDPQVHPALRQALLDVEMGDLTVEQPLAAPLNLDELLSIASEGDEATASWYHRDVVPMFPHRADVKQETHITTSADGCSIELEVYRPSHNTDPLPCIIYAHGGAMTMSPARNPYYDQWCSDLAAQGTIVVQVGFRNAWTPSGLNPFPAGLDDVVAAIEWAHDRRSELGIGAIVVQGESGGGNLACASAIRLQDRGDGEKLDGVYASCPFISGAYGWDDDRKSVELPSLIDLDGYLLGNPGMYACAALYDSLGQAANNPQAWPYRASVDDVAGLPPHHIVVHEFDPLRDEGIAYHRTLTEAGVRSTATVLLGLVHGAEFDFRADLPEHYRASIHSIVGFSADLMA